MKSSEVARKLKAVQFYAFRKEYNTTAIHITC